MTEEQLAEQGRTLIAAALADVHAPLALRERLESQRTRLSPARRRRRGMLGTVAVAGTALAIVIALLVVPGGTPGAPSLSQAASLGALAPMSPAPARDRANPRLLQESEGGITFPAWEVIDWRSSGERKDRIKGRDATTVYYRTPTGATVAYTIVDGDALEGTPSQGSKTLKIDGRNAVVWERNGRTCILTAPPDVPVQRLVELTGKH